MIEGLHLILNEIRNTRLVSFDFSFSEFAEIYKGDMSGVNARSGHDEVGVIVWERDEIVDLIFLEFKCLYNMLDL